MTVGQIKTGFGEVDDTTEVELQVRGNRYETDTVLATRATSGGIQTETVIIKAKTPMKKEKTLNEATS